MLKILKNYCNIQKKIENFFYVKKIFYLEVLPSTGLEENEQTAPSGILKTNYSI